MPPTTSRSGRPVRRRAFLLAGFVVILAIAGLLSFHASGAPDGLARVAQDTGLAVAERPSAAEVSPLAGYGTRGVDDERFSRGIAGVAGVLVTLIVAAGLFRLVRGRGTADRGS
jgi:hypothetical protein